VSRTLPDLTAPTGSYNTVVAGRSATLTELAVADDVTPAAQIQRTVDWGDGSPSASWTAGLSHTYPASPVLARYVPTMTLQDLAGNHVLVALPAVALADTDAPTGVFTAGPATGWARYTRIVLTQSSLADNLSPAVDIRRTVAWGDGATSTWTAGTTITHVYATAGAYTPSVLLIDEAHNASPAVPSSTVTVTQDATAPRVTLRLPAQPRTVVRKWVYLHGWVTDSGVGARSVRVRAVEKRGAYFYAYQPATRTWKRAGTTAAVAFRHAGVRTVRPTSTGSWTARLARLTLGTLSYRVVGVDQLGNGSRGVRHAQRLTRR
jgi:5'-nucleotidase